MNVRALRIEIEQEEVNRLVRRRIRNLSDSLFCIAGIAEGSNLVAMIGNGDENSNREAIHTWVSFELKQCGLIEENQLDYLYARLLMVLGDFTP